MNIYKSESLVYFGDDRSVVYVSSSSSSSSNNSKKRKQKRKYTLMGEQKAT